MKHFFILGKHPALSVSEINTVLSIKADLVSRDIATVNKKIQNLESLQEQLGGTIKIGTIIGNVTKENIKAELLNYIETELNTEQKIFFGLSSYEKSLNLKQTALELKKVLKQKSISSRWVQSREPALSSVVVKTNKLLSVRGVEFNIIPHNSTLFVGVTKTVQPFDEFSERDYGRPQANPKSGMLPPKLARIMINLAGGSKNKTLLDPFCGSGTVLQEAVLLGYTDIIGSDISKKSVEDTKKNINWLKEHKPKTQKAHISLFETDVRALPTKIKPYTIDVIVTEPFLGPPLRGNESPNPIIQELEQLYKESFIVFTKLLKKNGKIVIIFPVILKKHLSVEKIVPKNFLQLNPPFLYRREGQKVEREIFVFSR